MRFGLKLIGGLFGGLVAGIVTIFIYDFLKSRMCNTMGDGWLDLQSPTCRFLGPLDTDADQAFIVASSVFLTAVVLGGILTFRRIGNN